MNPPPRPTRFRSAPRFALRPPRSAFAFTLVEVIAALTILALVTGSVYALLRQSTEVAAELQNREREFQATRRFLDLCRSTLETLPPEATVSVASAEETGSTPELTITGAADAFRFSLDPEPEPALTLGLRPASSDFTANGATSESASRVAVTRETFAPEVEEGDFQVRAAGEDDFFQPDEQGRYWIPLLSGVEDLEWRYWDGEQETWDADWTDAPERPVLVEMKLWLAERPAPLRAVYAPPTAGPGTGTAPGAPAAPGTSSPGDAGSDRAGPPVPGGRRGPRGARPGTQERPGGARPGRGRPGGRSVRPGDGAGRGPGRPAPDASSPPSGRGQPRPPAPPSPPSPQAP